MIYHYRPSRLVCWPNLIYNPAGFRSPRALDDDSTVDVDEVNEDIVSHDHSVGPVTSSDPSSTAPHSGAVLYHPSQMRQWR
jgi:hypothetical protein